MLAGRDIALTHAITIVDSSFVGSDGYEISIRTYNPAIWEPGSLVVYYHGGGLYVGDLDSEDLSCRRICKEASAMVVSVEYRLRPDFTPAIALQDAYDTFTYVSTNIPHSKLVLVGSSSGGQLAAQVSQRARDDLKLKAAIDGILLRCPVTVDASHGATRIPERFQSIHTSYSESFSNCLVKLPTENNLERLENLPLDAKSFKDLPKTFLQLCSNDIYYSDGVCYAQGLKEDGAQVKVDVLMGWPHTFWLKAPELDQALSAERAMVDGIKWLTMAT